MLQAVTLKFHPTIQKYTKGVKEHTVSVNDLILSPKEAKVHNSLGTTGENYRLTSMLMLY